MQQQKKEVLSVEPEKESNKKIITFLSIVIILVVVAIFATLLYIYLQTPEHKLNLGANIENATISKDEKTAYVKLAGESNKNITKIKFIFKDNEGNEYNYETSEGAKEISVPFKRSFWDWLFRKPKYEGKYDYEINAEEINLNNFQNIEEVSVSFEYETETGEINETGIITSANITKIPACNDEIKNGGETGIDCGGSCKACSQGRGGGGGGTTTPEPTPTCTDSDKGINYYEKGTTSYSSTTNEDYCNNSILFEYYCNNTVIKEVHYDCSSEDKICLDGRCIELAECTSDENCSYLNDVCAVGVCNATGSCEITYNVSGTPCFLGVCNAKGKCVECLENSDCNIGEICENGECVINECLPENNCFYVSVTGAGNHNGSSGNEFNLSEAQAYANVNLDTEITFLLASGNYGGVIFNNVISRTGWDKSVIWKPASGENPVFNELSITGHVNRYLTFQDITMIAPDDSSYVAMVFIKYSSYIRVINCTLTGRWSPPNDTTDYAIYINGDNYEVEGILVDGCDMSQVGRGIVFKYDIGHDVVIRNSIIHKTHGTFIDIQADTDSYILIEYNHMYERDKAGSAYHGSGIGPTSAGQLTIRGNIIHDYGSSGGINFYPPGPVGGFEHILIENNLVYDAQGTTNSILAMLKGDITVRNNTFIGWNKGQYPSHPMANTDKYGAVLGFGAYDEVNGISDVYVYNNVVVGGTGIPAGKITNLQEDNNIFWSLNDENGYRDAAWGPNSIVICDAQGFNPGYDTNYFEGSSNFFLGDQTGVFNNYSYSRIYTITGTFVSGPDFSVGEQVQQTVPHTTATGIVISHESGTGTIFVRFNSGAAFQTAAYDSRVGSVIGTQSGAQIQDITFAASAPHRQNLNDAYYPLMSSPACNGSVNPVGVAVGALPCVCTNDTQCEEVFGAGATCDVVTGECVGGTGMGSFSPFAKLWNFLKSLLTKKTGKAILTGKTITGNVVNETDENGESKVPYIILSILAVIILIIAVIIVKIKKNKKKSKKKIGKRIRRR